MFNVAISVARYAWHAFNLTLFFVNGLLHIIIFVWILNLDGHHSSTSQLASRVSLLPFHLFGFLFYFSVETIMDIAS